jgi:hypothetical protein
VHHSGRSGVSSELFLGPFSNRHGVAWGIWRPHNFSHRRDSAPPPPKSLVRPRCEERRRCTTSTAEQVPPRPRRLALAFSNFWPIRRAALVRPSRSSVARRLQLWPVQGDMGALGCWCPEAALWEWGTRTARCGGLGCWPAAVVKLLGFQSLFPW